MSKMSRYGKFMMMANTRNQGNQMRGNQMNGSQMNGGGMQGNISGGEHGGPSMNGGYQNAYNGGQQDFQKHGEDYRYGSPEGRFRDSGGRERYDSGRFAPRNAMENYGGDERPRSEYRAYGNNESGGMDARGDGGSRMEGRINNIIGFEARGRSGGKEEDSKQGGSMKRGGSKGGEQGGEFTKEMAKEWTRKMQNEDGSKGEHWTEDQVKSLMSNRGMHEKVVEVYAVMNAMYSDYYKVMSRYGLTSPEVYLDLALAFLNDKDAVEDKAMAYYECIVK